MAYIYKKIIHGTPYYYLRVSKRVDGKVAVKDIAYLGNDVSEVESRLKSLRSYKSEIRKAYRNIRKFVQGEHYLKEARKLKLKENPYLGKRLLEEAEAIMLHFSSYFLKKDKKVQEEVYKNFLIDFAFNTTSLEGNTITLSEVNKLLKENLAPKNRTLREIYDLQNTERAFFEIACSEEEITPEFIIRTHDMLMEKIDDRKGYRTHDIKVFKSHFEATPSPYIKDDVELLLRLYKRYEGRLHPLALAGIFHQKFEKIHPFADGNGRTGRMIMCHMLMKKGCPPLIVRKSERGDYLDAMAAGDKADLNNVEPLHYKPIAEYLAGELIAGYWNSFNV